MIVVTGGAGFIGSCFVKKLNQMGIDDILIVDNLGKTEKWQNLVKKNYKDYLHKNVFISSLISGKMDKIIDSIVHIGACSATTETNADYLMENNIHYSMTLANWAIKNNKKMWYASSAATYGDGELGYSDEDEKTPEYRPLNMYGYSKHTFDLWVLRNKLETNLTGFKFFNVFGPNEYHKDKQRSLIHKAFPKARDDHNIKLFKSYLEDYEDGGQKRDFVYVKDILEVMTFFFQNPDIGGIYNIGTGNAHTWNDVANAMFKALNVDGKIDYVPMPDELQGKYQYFTEADLTKLRRVGCKHQFMSLEDSVADYLKNHLMKTDSYF